MSSNTHQVRVSISNDDSPPMVIDTEGKVNEVHRILANKWRRQVLCALRRESLPIDVRMLARQVTIQDACENSKMVTDDSITGLEIALYHQHLPMMANIGLIDYTTDETIDGTSGRVDAINV